MFMRERIAVLLDLVSIIERMKFNSIVFEFIQIIILHDNTLVELTKAEKEVLEAIRKKLIYIKGN